jgi:hypothetical protein
VGTDLRVQVVKASVLCDHLSDTVKVYFNLYLFFYSLSDYIVSDILYLIL